jgi:hypothetical protein
MIEGWKCTDCGQVNAPHIGYCDHQHGSNHQAVPIVPPTPYPGYKVDYPYYNQPRTTEPILWWCGPSTTTGKAAP